MEAFTYLLSEGRIAQRPVRPYDSAKLLITNRQQSSLTESVFSDITTHLGKTDLLVFNDTSVIPARFFGKFADTGGQCEILLVHEAEDFLWQVLARPQKKFTKGREILFDKGLSGKVLNTSEQYVLLKFSDKDLLSEVGCMPIPPYIRKGESDEQDKVDYQTFFAKAEGSIAAPTASLHFTPELIEKIKDKTEIVYLTLHVGTASFLPLFQPGDDELKKPGEESYYVPLETRDKIIQHKKDGGRVIAVGTTVVRALESMVRSEVENDFVNTDLFIQPGFEFKITDAMITNFHQPGTTHLLLVEAFIGRKLLQHSYDYALNKEFRFLSYGDGMLCL